MNRKKIGNAMIGVSLLLIISAIVILINSQYGEESYNYTVKKSDGTQVNTSEELKKTKYYEGLEISSTALVHHSNDVNNFEINVYNPTDNDITLGNVTVELFDDDGNTIAILYGYLPEVKAKQKFSTTFAATNDKVADAYDFKIYKEILIEDETEEEIAEEEELQQE